MKLLLLALLPMFVSAQTVNPSVTQGNIKNTICVSGWTATVRPPVSYTDRIKKGLLKDKDASLYELDHLVPLAVGGNPTDPKNLALQSWEGPTGAKVKDKVEVKVQKAVCAGKMTLAQGQACFINDWSKCK